MFAGASHSAIRREDEAAAPDHEGPAVDDHDRPDQPHAPQPGSARPDAPAPPPAAQAPPAPAPAAPARRAKAPARDDAAEAQRRDRALIRKTVTKATAVGRAKPRIKELVADVLSPKPDVTDTAELTVAIMTADSAAVAPLADLVELAAMDPMEAGVTLMTVDRADLRSTWSLLTILDLAEGALPTVDAKAALAVARAAGTIEPGHTAELRAAVELAKH
jgi:hypothetical protein